MKLDLYMFETCPYCRKVMREIEAQGRKDITYHDIHKNEEDRQTLIRVGGKEQVPCYHQMIGSLVKNFHLN